MEPVDRRSYADREKPDENRLLQAIARAQREFIAGRNTRECFETLLAILLDITNSEYGFVGEVLYKADGTPFLRSHALTNIAWDEATRRFYDEHAERGMEFHNLQTLFGAVMTTGAPVVSNSPSTDARRGGLPPGHPPLKAFLGIPFKSGERMVGMVGVANRPGGYDEAVLQYLDPLLATCASLIEGHRLERARLETESVLRETGKRLQAIVGSATDAIITITSEGEILSANPAAEFMFGSRAEEMLGSNVSVLMPSPMREQHDQYIAQYLKSGERKIIGRIRETIAQRKDGSTFPVHISVSEVKLPDRRLFTGILRDISDLKAAQEKVESTLALVEKSRGDLLAILNQLHLGSAMIDGTGNVTFLSAYGRQLLGLPAEADLGGSWDRIFPLDGEAKQRLKEMMSAPEARRKKVPLHIEAENGQHFWMDVEVRDDPGDPAGRILVMYDTTELQDLRRQLDEHATFHDLVGKSEPMQRVFQSVVDLAKMDVTVLIEGETGTGKELVARAIHSASHRKGKPFVAVNCAGLSDSLLGSQLFGHRRGAFTGAIADQAGIFETADGGTVFLDEIGDISSEVQRSLLRVLQEREITRLGESRARKVDVRVIAATHRNLKREVEEGRFRMDLLYRVRVAPIHLPPLRERRGDIPLLSAAFLRAVSARAGKKIAGISRDAIAVLIGHSWPGNVRELQNAIEYAVVRCRADKIEVRDLPPEIVAYADEVEVSHDPLEAERRRIRVALKAAQGKRAAAARALGMSRATFYRRLKDLGIDPEAGGGG